MPKKTRKLKAALMIYAAWNIWKERNRRVFNQKYGTLQEVLQEVNREVNDRKQACGGQSYRSRLMFKFVFLEFEFISFYVISNL